MSIEEMRAYMQLCLEGEASIPGRKVMLAEKRERLVERLAEVQASIDYIDWKQGFYDDVLAGPPSTTATCCLATGPPRIVKNLFRLLFAGSRSVCPP